MLLGERAEPVRRALAIASIIGPSFTLSELRCLSGGESPSIMQLLSAAETGSLITSGGPIYQFLNDSERELLQFTDPRVRREMHEQFADCLRRLRPGDYVFRANQFALAERQFESAVMRVHAYVAELRQGLRPDPTTLDLDASNGIVSLRDFAKTISDMQRLFDSGQYDDVVMRRSDCDALLPRSLLAESDILSARGSDQTAVSSRTRRGCGVTRSTRRSRTH